MGEGALSFSSKRKKDEAERGNRPSQPDALQRERLSPGPGWVKGANKTITNVFITQKAHFAQWVSAAPSTTAF